MTIEGHTKVMVENNDCLVLGAFGCGVFKNPPATVAALFHEALENSEFKYRFRLVSF